MAASRGMHTILACSCSAGRRKLFPVTHVIFDLDGTILDTETIYNKVFSNIATQYGSEYPPDMQMKVLGTTGIEAAKIVVQTMNLPIEPEEFYRQQKESAKQLLGECTFMPGAERLIRHLHTHNVPIAVASNSSMESYQFKIARHKEVFSLFSHHVMAATDPEVQHVKPAPDVFCICASRFPDMPSVEKCLVFEDSTVGVTAGIAAGMQVVMVPFPNSTEEGQRKATLVISSLLNFQPELFGLPSF